MSQPLSSQLPVQHPGTHYDRALSAARATGLRLSDVPGGPIGQVNRVDCRERADAVCLWDTCSLACGAVGLSLLYRSLAHAFPSEDWLPAAMGKLQLAARESEVKPIRSWGLFHGTAGLGMALHDLVPVLPRLRASQAAVAAQVAAQIKNTPPRRTQEGIAHGDFDVIKGAAGALAYLIRQEERTGEVTEAITILLDSLIWYGLLGVDGDRMAWHVPPALTKSGFVRQTFPDGYLDLGLAHGIAGVLAALALSWASGIRGERHREAMDVLVDVLWQHASYDQCGIYWPTRVVRDPSRVNRGEYQRDRRAWCYGSPGVAVSLRNVSIAIDDEPLRNLAYEGLVASLRRPGDREAAADSSSICHGLGGLLMIGVAFARGVNDSVLDENILRLVEALLSKCDDGNAYMVREPWSHNTAVDCPGFLIGAAGTALALLTFAGRAVGTSNSCLLIAE